MVLTIVVVILGIRSAILFVATSLFVRCPGCRWAKLAAQKPNNNNTRINIFLLPSQFTGIEDLSVKFSSSGIRAENIKWKSNNNTLNMLITKKAVSLLNNSSNNECNNNRKSIFVNKMQFTYQIDPIKFSTLFAEIYF